ncbi:MAG: hypothetical protein EHM78_11580 [Myxococcaceae bacterium]|nr:MAG: hypothetical protein EHM78_11580 [Myxococcaceae bacterium]
MRALEIFDTDEHGKLAGSLEDILRLADPPASRLTWTLRYIEARDEVTAAWPAGLKDLEAQASARKFGLELSWEQLKALAAVLRAPVDVRLDGWARAPKLGGAPGELVLRIEVLDSTLFRVAARERPVLTRLERRFKDTRSVEVSEMY